MKHKCKFTPLRIKNSAIIKPGREHLTKTELSDYDFVDLVISACPCGKVTEAKRK